MKRILALVGVAAGAFTLTGCDLNNEEMSNIIQKCKEDTECKAILDQEIDEALAERGIFANDSFESDEYEIFYDLELTDEEMQLIETLENLDLEVWETIEGMSEEQLKELEIQEFENMLGRTLTDAEKTALDTVEALWNIEIADVDADFETEQEYLEFFLGRELTDEEKNAFAIIDAIDWENFDEETGEMNLTPEQETALDMIDALYSTYEEMSETQELELMLGRQLTEVELNALSVIDEIDWEDFDDYDNELTFTEEQEAAFDLIDALYSEIEANYETIELELLLGRELTNDEIEALDIVNNLYDEMYNNFDEDAEYDEVAEMISFYEEILNRELTDQEKEAIEFSLDFFFYEDDYYEDDYFFEDDYYYEIEEYDEDFEDNTNN